MPEGVFAFGDTLEMTDELGTLMVQGVNPATNSALWAYAEGKPLPAVGKAFSEDMPVICERFRVVYLPLDV